MPKSLFKTDTIRKYVRDVPKKDKLFIVDGNFFLHRAKHAMENVPPMNRSSDDFDTRICKGFLNILCSELDFFQPTHCVIVFDGAGKNFRHTLYPEYKSNRQTEDSVNIFENNSLRIWDSLAYIKEVLPSMGIHFCHLKNTEGDDVIATLISMFESDIPIVISSADKDMHCLLSESVYQFNGITKKVITPSVVESKFGVKVGQMTDYLAMVGDKIDNIPGVPNFGAKTAQLILSKCDSVAKFVSKEYNEGSKPAKLKEKLLAEYDSFKLSRKLVRLQIQNLVNSENEELTLGDCLISEPDEDALQEWLDSMEFRYNPAYINRLLGIDTKYKKGKRVL